MNTNVDWEQFSTEHLLPIVYDEVRRLAACKLQRERPDLTIQGTALVHEAFLRLTQGGTRSWRSRMHLVAAFAETMRRILVEEARRRTALKRGRNATRCPLDAADVGSESAEETLLALDDSLQRLSQLDPQKEAIVRLRFFADLTIAEIAETLDMSPRMVDRHWAYARAWLLRDMRRALLHDG